MPGLADLAPDGAIIPFADGHQRQLPVLTGGPFRYQVHAEQYLKTARQFARLRPAKPILPESCR